jgi:hypothetical protein
VFPTSLTVRLVQTLGQGLYFAGSFREELYFRQSCLLVVNAVGVIENLSSSCHDILQLDFRMCQVR